MTLPRDVITIAALGTEHSATKLENLSNYEGHLPSIDESQAIERQLLQIVARLTLKQQAGQSPPIDPCSLPQPSTYRRLKPCSHRLHRLFHRILTTRELRESLPEFTRATVKAGFRPPEEFLPIIIKSCDRQFRNADQPLTWLGERAVWLNMLKQTDGDTSIAARIRYWRQHEPAYARKMIADEWASTDIQKRLELLDAMHDGLSEEDEDFIEAVLDETYVTRQERHLVRDLLVRLPSSRFNQVVMENAPQYAMLDDEFQRIFLAFPRETDPELARYGIFRPELTMANVSHRVIRFVSPSFWQELWGISTHHFLSAAANSLEKPLIWTSIVYGTIHHQDTLFAGQLFEQVYGVINTELCRKLAALLSPLEREIHLIRMVEQHPKIHEKWHPVRGILYNLDAPWSTLVTEALLEKLTQNIKWIRFPYGPAFMFLTDFAPKMPIELCYEFLETLKVIKVSSPKWDELLLEIQEFLDFRVEMLEALRLEQKAMVD